MPLAPSSTPSGPVPDPWTGWIVRLLVLVRGIRLAYGLGGGPADGPTSRSTAGTPALLPSEAGSEDRSDADNPQLIVCTSITPPGNWLPLIVIAGRGAASGTAG